MTADPTFLSRFEAKYTPEPNSGCWLWTAACLESGYGQIYFQGRRRNAHRAAYEFFKGPVPNGLEVHHTCNVRNCVNPLHFVATTHRTNMLASDTGPGLNAKKTECKRGHAFTASNTYLSPSGSRVCRQCGRESARERAKRGRVV